MTAQPQHCHDHLDVVLTAARVDERFNALNDLVIELREEVRGLKVEVGRLVNSSELRVAKVQAQGQYLAAKIAGGSAAVVAVIEWAKVMWAAKP